MGHGERAAAADTYAGPKPVTIRSQSGQFLVRGLPQNPPLPSSLASTSALQYLRLDPNLTAISLERVRQSIQAELNWPNEWKGMVTVLTVPVRGENTRVTITSLRHPSSWGYQIVFPEIVDKDRFLGAAVKTVLMEFANRRAHLREAEIPLWLSEGLTAELKATSLPVLALESSTEINRRGQNGDPLAKARERLRGSTPLSFDDLSMPLGELSDEEAAQFRACAQVFVHELLRLRDGRASLRRFLERLPENLNWQTTFLEAFSRHFTRLLDVDQWYSLNVAGTRGRDLSSILTPIATLQQLDSLLLTPVDVRLVAQELPLRTELKLQQVIEEWDYPRQHAVLVEKIGRLRNLHGRGAPEAAGVVAGYLDALTEYVGPRNLAVPSRQRDLDRLKPRGERRTVLSHLERLELRRSALAQAIATPGGRTQAEMRNP
jgi:hypothetical protein